MVARADLEEVTQERAEAMARATQAEESCAAVQTTTYIRHLFIEQIRFLPPLLE
jgi:hypothetical protein